LRLPKPGAAKRLRATPKRQAAALPGWKIFDDTLEQGFLRGAAQRAETVVWERRVDIPGAAFS
jgi:hypothetical protein